LPASRTIYCAKHLDTVYILHAFTKTRQKVDQKEMDTAPARYKQMLAAGETVDAVASAYPQLSLDQIALASN
jgi:hypothetical protein